MTATVCHLSNTEVHRSLCAPTRNKTTPNHRSLLKVSVSCILNKLRPFHIDFLFLESLFSPNCPCATRNPLDTRDHDPLGACSPATVSRDTPLCSATQPSPIFTPSHKPSQRPGGFSRRLRTGTTHTPRHSSRSQEGRPITLDPASPQLRSVSCHSQSVGGLMVRGAAFFRPARIPG